MSCITTIKERGLKLTPQRRLILDIIHESDTHVTAEEIVSLVQARMPGVNKSTIYRTLELLDDIGCVVKGESHGRSIYHHAEGGHHHHIECRACGNTVDCSEDLFASVEKALYKKYGFHADFKHTVIKGLCSQCRIERS
jgi:Fur family ferric uptake transcriptional regulator